MVGLMLDLQTFQLKYGVNGHEHVVTLRGYTVRVGGFASPNIAALDLSTIL